MVDGLAGWHTAAAAAPLPNSSAADADAGEWVGCRTPPASAAVEVILGKMKRVADSISSARIARSASAWVLPPRWRAMRRRERTDSRRLL